MEFAAKCRSSQVNQLGSDLVVTQLTHKLDCAFLAERRQRPPRSAPSARRQSLFSEGHQVVADIRRRWNVQGLEESRNRGGRKP